MKARGRGADACLPALPLPGSCGLSWWPTHLSGGTPLQKAALYTAGIFFAVGAIVHAIRLVTGFGIVVGTITVPVWVSIPALLAGVLLAIWMAVAARRS